MVFVGSGDPSEEDLCISANYPGIKLEDVVTTRARASQSFRCFIFLFLKRLHQFAKPPFIPVTVLEVCSLSFKLFQLFWAHF